MNSLFIHSARQLITLRGTPGPRRGASLGQLQIIDDGAVWIENGVIREVGPTRRLENLAGVRSLPDLSAAGKIVMPGFVDCHTHLVSGPVLAGATSLREATSRRLTSDAELVVARCLEHGTTTIEAKSGYGQQPNSELKVLRVLTALGDAPITVVPTFAAAPQTPEGFAGGSGYIEWLAGELLPAVHRRGLARFVDASCSPSSFTAAELRPLFQAARALGLPMKLSLTHASDHDSALLSEFDFTSVDHLEDTDEHTVRAVAASPAVAVLTPSSEFFRQTARGAPARELIDRGAAVALGSDYSRAASPNHNMQMVVFLACRAGMSAAEALTAATINSAYALKLGHRTGSIEPGKQADLLVLSTGDYRTLAHEFGDNLVEMTIRNGSPIVQERTRARWQRAS